MITNEGGENLPSPPQRTFPYYAEIATDRSLASDEVPNNAQQIHWSTPIVRA
jgi:hypothetical protein